MLPTSTAQWADLVSSTNALYHGFDNGFLEYVVNIFLGVIFGYVALSFIIKLLKPKA